jgi:hypothetical protein
MNKMSVRTKVGCGAALGILTLIAAGASAAPLQTTLNNFLIDMNRPSGSCASFVQAINATPGTVCALTGSGGRFDGVGENGSLGLEGGSVWVFRGNSCQPGVHFRVSCFRST